MIRTAVAVTMTELWLTSGKTVRVTESQLIINSFLAYAKPTVYISNLMKV